MRVRRWAIGVLACLPWLAMAAADVAAQQATTVQLPTFGVAAVKTPRTAGGGTSGTLEIA